MIDLSILIPTHNRPKYFQRCLKSAIEFCPNAHIIVNNDSCDIEETYDVDYYYYEGKCLSDVYRFLVNKVKTKYLYFLEDDDFLLPGFENKIKNVLTEDHDLIFGKYIPCDKDFTDSRTFKYTFNLICNQFNIESEYFQLGQTIFKRSLFDEFKWFKDSDIHNDYKLVKHFLKDHNYISINKFFYRQCYVGDNISIKPKHKKSLT